MKVKGNVRLWFKEIGKYIDKVCSIIYLVKGFIDFCWIVRFFLCINIMEGF